MVKRAGIGNNDRWVASAIFIVLAMVYWHGRSLSFGGGDSPEHVVSCLTWGVSHTPGYPLYTLLGHLFSKLPFGTPEGNVNWFSGVCQAAAAAVLFLLMRRFKLSLPAALTSAGLAAFSPLFWYYSEIPEVRSLNNLLAVLSAHLAVRYGQTKRRRDLSALAAVLGLGISHHPTYVLILPAIAFWLWREGVLPRGRQALYVCLGVIGCCTLPYLILGIRLHVSPPVYNTWGIRTWSDLSGLFLRRELGAPWRVVAGGRGMFESVAGSGGGFKLELLVLHSKWLADSLWFDGGSAGLGLALIGAIWLASRQRQILGFVGIWLGVSVAACLLLVSQQLILFDVPYVHTVALRFYLLPLLAVFIVVGFGVDGLAQRSKPVTAWILMAAAVLPFVANPVNLKGRDVQLRYGRDILNSSGHDDLIIMMTEPGIFAMDYLDYVQHQTEHRAFLVTPLFSSPRYLHALKRRYPDLNVPLDGSGMISTDWREWLRRNPNRRLCSESVFPLSLAQQFPGLSPSGVLVSPSVKRPKPQIAAAKARRFLDETSIGRLSLADIYPRSPDIYMRRVARGLLSWYNSLLDAKKDAALRADIQRRLARL
ncbi:MAG: DUF2723 domain-containing protein [Elusimicrobia bacterium]|nr:DUF2723 domain-containing protein [Elusimicrobiota bacterium]